MKISKNQILGIILAGVFLIGQPAPDAMARGGVEIGLLTCNSIEGTRQNLLVYSSIDVTCVLKTPYGHETYIGSTGIGLGADLNWSRSETMFFTVLAATSDTRVGSHALAGKYFGAKGSATVGVGWGAGAFVGAGPKNITLQPVALEYSTGLGAAAGLSYLFLDPVYQ